MGSPTNGSVFNVDASILNKDFKGEAEIRLVRNKADELRIIKPARHSGRIVMCATLHALGVDPQEIALRLNWKSGLRMVNYYLNTHNDCMPSSAPTVLAESIDKIDDIHRSFRKKF